jgi:hypothetical protein
VTFHDQILRQTGQFENGPAPLALHFQPKQEQGGDHGSPDLNQDGVLRNALKSFDFQIVLNPPKKVLIYKRCR